MRRGQGGGGAASKGIKELRSELKPLEYISVINDAVRHVHFSNKPYTISVGKVRAHKVKTRGEINSN